MSLWIKGLSRGIAEHQLFLAESSGTREVVRVFNVGADQLDADDAYTAPSGEQMINVAYVAESHSLFVATLKTDERVVRVRSLLHTNGQWNVSNLTQFISSMFGDIFLQILLDGTFFWSQWDTEVIHVCDVYSDRTLRNCESIPLQAKHYGFDAQLLRNERRIVVALQDGSVALMRVHTMPFAFTEISRVNLTGARIPMFCDNGLLVKVESGYNRVKSEAVSFTITDGHLHRYNQLIPRGALNIVRWLYVDGTVFAWNYHSDDLIIFNSS